MGHRINADGIKDNGKGCHSDRSNSDGNMNVPGRDIGPGGLESKQEVIGSVERDWKHKIGVKGARDDGRWWGTDGEMSAPRCKSKRLTTEH